MAEAIAFAASVVAIIQITDRIAGLCKRYIQATRDALSDLRSILLEVSTLRAVLQNVEFLTAEKKEKSTIIKALSLENGLIERFHRSMTELEELLQTDFTNSKKDFPPIKRRKQVILAALQWPLKENKAKRLMEEIARFKTTITLALTTESTEALRDVKAELSNIHASLKDDQRREVYRWLQYTDPSELHHRAQKNYEPGTGHWVMSFPEWRDWIDANLRCLWIHGIPGAGKTVLVSHLIEEITQYCDISAKIGVTYVYYYCYFGRSQDETKPFLQWLVKCLCQKVDIIPASLYKLFKYDSPPSLKELLKVLQEILEHFEIVYLVIDAIDESSPREDLLEVLRDLVIDTRFRKIQLLASSREYVDIENTMKEICADLPMKNTFVMEDIRLHVKSALNSNVKFRRWPQDILEEAEDALIINANGMFRWAVCQIDVLQRLKCDQAIIKKELKNLPKTLYEVYSRIWPIIQEDEAVFVFHVLQWIIHHNEVNHGEGIPFLVLLQAAEKSMAYLLGHTNNRAYDEDVLREVCGCLIRVETPSASMSSNAKSVSFAHYTVREFLESRHFSSTIANSFTYSARPLMSIFTEIVYTEVLSSRLDKIGKTQSYSVSVNDNFTVYCAFSALLLINDMDGGLSNLILNDDKLKDFTIDILEPFRPHFETLAQVINENDSKTFWRFSHYPYTYNFWGIEWDPLCRNTAAAHLFNLILSSYRTDLSLVKRYLSDKNSKDISKTRLKFSNTSIALKTGIFARAPQFEGSVIEVAAQLSWSSKGFAQFLDFFEGYFDPTMVLFYQISYQINRWSQKMKLESKIVKLLNFGADPNIAGYVVTPLQIAVKRGLVESTRALLEAGAHVNATGDENGCLWQENTPMFQFNDLHGASPLYICENDSGNIFGKVSYDQSPKAALEIKAMLLSYEAKSFQIIRSDLSLEL